MGDPDVGEKRSGCGRGPGRVPLFVPGEGWGSRARGSLCSQRLQPVPGCRSPGAVGRPHPAISKGKVYSTPHRPRIKE